MSGGVDMPHGSLAAGGETGAHLLLCPGGGITDSTQTPAWQSNIKCSNSGVLSLLPQHMQDRRAAPEGLAGVMLHITTLPQHLLF